MKTAQKESTVNSPKEAFGYQLHPGKFGIIEWLQSTRSNPAITSEREPGLRDIAELCWAFTRPSSEVTGMPPKQVDAEIRTFMDGLDPEAFHAIQKHAETELLKFTQTKAAPKKKARPLRAKTKVKR